MGRGEQGRRAVLAAGIGAGLVAAAPGARAQAWPTRPITVVVGFPPGGQTDFAARIVQPGVSGILGQTLVIDNKAGAGGNLGTEAVLRARPDGYTLLAGNANPLTINPHTMQGVTFDPRRLTPIGLALSSALILCVHPSLPVRNVAEFATWVKAQPGGANYGTASAGSLTHLAMELLRVRIGNPAMESVPYRGSAPAMQDLLGGQIPALFDAASVVAPFIKAGQVRPILVTSAERVGAFPDVPTAAEQGLADFTFLAWIGLFGPPGLPPEIVTRVNDALNRTLADPSIRDKITSLGDNPGGGTAEAMGATLLRDYARWGEVVKASGIRVE